MKQWLRVVMVLVLMGFGGSVWAYCVPGTDMSDGYCQRDWATQGAGESQPADSDYRAPARQWHDSFGAVAWSPSGSYGYSSNQPSKSAGKQAALSDCGEQGCHIVWTYHNQCLAVSFGLQDGGRNGYRAAGVSEVQSDAEQEALRNCDAQAQNCKLVISECSLPY